MEDLEFSKDDGVLEMSMEERGKLPGDPGS